VIRGLVCGTFDLCHAGHVTLLEAARQECDHLVVGLQADPSFEQDVGYRVATGRRLKNKPVLSVEERSVVLRAIRHVDDLFVYTDEASLVAWMLEHPIDVRIFGEDWRGKPYTGQGLGHRVVFVPLVISGGRVLSSSDIRKRIQG
jgi:glycerol-3-phosphate cytidylyltransferase